MGLHDAEEMLEVAKADAAQLERENRRLRAVLARIGDHAREVPEATVDDTDYHFGRGRLAAELLALVDEAAGDSDDLSPLSTLYVGGLRQTWQQVAIDREERLRELEPVLTMLSDLDRSRQGRHEGDVEGGAVSLGNPHLSTGQTIGYSIGGSFAYVVPEPRLRGDVAAWKQRRP